MVVNFYSFEAVTKSDLVSKKDDELARKVLINSNIVNKMTKTDPDIFTI